MSDSFVVINSEYCGRYAFVARGTRFYLILPGDWRTYPVIYDDEEHIKYDWRDGRFLSRNPKRAWKKAMQVISKNDKAMKEFEDACEKASKFVEEKRNAHV